MTGPKISGLPGSLTCYTTEPKDWTLLPAAGAAIAGYLYTSAVSLHTQRKDEAFRFLTRIEQNRDFLTATFNVRRFFEENEGLTRSEASCLIKSDKRAHIELKKDIRDVANFYEEMAIAIKYGEVHESLLEEFYAGLLVKFYEHFRPIYLKELRAIRNRPDLYCNIDALYDRWKPRYEKMLKDLNKN